MAYCEDLRQYIRALENSGKLVRIKRVINKDTELHPVVRWQFRGLPESRRKAFLFENVVDVNGKKYACPVLVACHAASRETYAMAMGCKPGAIMEKWNQAQLHPIKPELVSSGQHIITHWDKCRKRGIPLQAAVVIGPSPNVGLVATAKLPYGVDELAVAGGIANAPVKVVKCHTVNLEALVGDRRKVSGD